MGIDEGFGGAAGPSLQNLIDEASRRGLLPQAQLARARSAAAALANFLGRPVADISGHQGFVIAQIKRMRKAPSKLTQKTLSNYRSELCGLIRATRGRGPKSPQPLSAAWRSLKSSFKSSADWAPFSRLAGFASTHAVAPAGVDDALVEKFIVELETLGDVADSKAHDRRLRRQWNRQKAAAPDFALQELALEVQARVRWTVPASEFHPLLIRDLDNYLAWLADDNPIGQNPGRGLRATTIKSTHHQLIKAATALVQSGRALGSITSLADLCSVVNVRAVMTVLYRRQNSKTSHALHRLGLSLVCVARDWVHADQDAIVDLKRFVTGFVPKERDDTPSRTRKRLQAFEDERLLSQLLTLPIQLLDEAKSAKQARKRAMLAQSAIACELLIYAPLRIENLAALQIDRTLKRERGRWLICLPGSAVKNGRDQLYQIPAEAVARFQSAMRLYEQPDGWLFPGRASGSKSSSSLSGQIKSTVEHRLGVPFHPHLYRAIAVYLQVLAHGAQGLEVGRIMLGNRDAATIRKNYGFLADRELLRQAQEEIVKQQAAAIRRRR